MKHGEELIFESYGEGDSSRALSDRELFRVPHGHRSLSRRPARARQSRRRHRLGSQHRSSDQRSHQVGGSRGFHPSILLNRRFDPVASVLERRRFDRRGRLEPPPLLACIIDEFTPSRSWVGAEASRTRVYDIFNFDQLACDTWLQRLMRGTKVSASTRTHCGIRH